MLPVIPMLFLVLCSQAAETEPKPNSPEAVQLAASDEVACNRSSAAAADSSRHGEHDNQTVQQLKGDLCHDVNATSIDTSTSEVLSLESDAVEKEALDNTKQKANGDIKVYDVDIPQSLKSSQSGLSGSECKMDICCDTGVKSAGDVLRCSTSENSVVDESRLAAVNSRPTSPHTCDGTSQNLCRRFSPKDLPEVELQSLQSLATPGFTKAEVECVADEIRSIETSVSGDSGVRGDRQSEEKKVESPSDSSVPSENPVLQDSAVKAGGDFVMSSSENVAGEMARVNTKCCQICPADMSTFAVNIQDPRIKFQTTSSISQSLGSSETEARRVADRNHSTETLSNDDVGVFVQRIWRETAGSLSDTAVMPQVLVQQDSNTDPGDYVLSHPEKSITDISSDKIQCYQTDESIDSVLVVDAHNSPVQSETTRSISQSLGSADVSETERKGIIDKHCSAERLADDDHGMLVQRSSEGMAKSTPDTFVISVGLAQQDSHAQPNICNVLSSEKASTTKTTAVNQCCQTDEYAVNASELLFDAHNSPVPTRSSVGCSPLQLPTETSETAERGVQTSPCTVDGSSSPLRNVVTRSIGCSPVAVETRSAGTSPVLFVSIVGCSMQTKPWMTDVQCSAMTVPHCDDAQNSSSHSSRYNTASTDIADSQKTVKDSTQPHSSYSCEELFDDEWPLIHRSASVSNATHRPCSTSPSPLIQSQTSGVKTRNMSNYNQPADSQEHAAEKLLNSDISYSLESSQVLPKSSCKETDDDVKTDQADSEDETGVHFHKREEKQQLGLLRILE